MAISWVVRFNAHALLPSVHLQPDWYTPGPTRAYSKVSMAAVTGPHIPSVSGKVVFDPVSSSTAYLLSAEFKPNPSFIQSPQGIFKTTDNGQTWIPMNKGLEASVATALVINPFRPSTLHLAVKPSERY